MKLIMNNLIQGEQAGLQCNRGCVNQIFSML